MVNSLPYNRSGMKIRHKLAQLIEICYEIFFWGGGDVKSHRLMILLLSYLLQILKINFECKHHDVFVT